MAWGEGAALLLAGPGSGKTRVLASRIANLLDRLDGEDFHILAITFTNRATDEIRDRISSISPRAERRAMIRTFHSFCMRVLQEHGEKVGVKPNFLICAEDEERLEIIDNALKEISDTDSSYGFELETTSPKKWLEKIDKLQDQPAKTSQKQRYVGKPNLEERIYLCYEKILARANMLDFNSLITKSIDLFENFPNIAETYKRKYPYWIIDEFQDTDLAQYRLIKSMSGERFSNIFVAADNDQNIFEWKGSSLENAILFKKDYSANVFRLGVNYRSEYPIVRAAYNLISHNKKRVLAVEAPRSSKHSVDEVYKRNIRVFLFPDEKSEVAWVADDIAQYDRSRLGNIVVLARRLQLIKSAKSELDSRGVKAFIQKRQNSFLTPEFKWLFASLRLVVNPTSKQILTTVVKEFNKLVETEIDLKNILEGAKRNSTTCLAELISQVKSSTKYGRVRSLTVAIERFEKTDTIQVIEMQNLVDNLQQGCEESSLSHDFWTDRDVWSELSLEIQKHYGSSMKLQTFVLQMQIRSKTPKPKPKTVSLMTIHSAKGCEYKIVYFIGVTKDIIPDYRSKSEDKLEQERRNCFVAVTRASELLTLSYSEASDDGKWPRGPSRFIREMGLVGEEPCHDPTPEAFIEDEDSIYDFEPEYFDKKWIPLLTSLNNRGVIVCSGGDIDKKGEVVGQYFAKVEIKGKAVCLVDGESQNSDVVVKILKANGDNVILVEEKSPDVLEIIQDALHLD